MTGRAVWFGNDAGLEVNVSPNQIGTASDWNPQTTSMPDPTSTPPKGGELVQDFLRQDHKPKVGGGIDCLIRAFLNLIAWAEGSDDYRRVALGVVIRAPSYPQLIGQRNVRIPGEETGAWPNGHPMIQVRYGGPRDTSSAAGRYQIMPGTWNHFMGKDVAFTPANQDLYGVKQLVVLGVPDLLRSNNFDDAVRRANGTWCSFPDQRCPGKQSPRSWNETRERWNELKRECG